ncbi:MAG: DNA polymerase/3'-5' exonuclease PolX [Acidobacteria bacterium]|nr:DNA polymerase/3'-5' exonuclease PolX [Acidobacteriota bacterium]
MKNRELADIFEKMADILEFKGENPFKVNAYRKVARVLKDLSEDVAEIAKEGKLEGIPGVGSGIAKKIKEYLETGRIAKYEEVKEGVPAELIEMMKIPGMGPKTVALVYKKLGISTISALEEAVKEGRLRELFGMGPKKEENILRGIRLLRESKGRKILGQALPLVEEIISLLKERSKTLNKIEPAGSLRRMRETVGDLDILATGTDPKEIIDTFVSLPPVVEVLASGTTKGSVIVSSGMQIDLRVVPEDSYGAALQYFTGSKAHNIHLRNIAKDRGLKINEYGVFRGEEKIAGKEEEEVYAALSLPFIPPELREDRGEIEAAYEGKLPQVVGYDEMRGDFHVHSKWSDGSASIREIAEKAKELGYEYLVIADHSQSMKFAGGLTPEMLINEIKEIRRVNEEVSGITLLAGAEVDIRMDGTLDFPDEVLTKLDVVIAAVHSGFKQSREEMTRRIIRALRHPEVDILAHPTGRIIGEREPYAVDIEEVIAEAAKLGKILEINAYYQRLDLNDVYSRRAKELGVKLAIGTDAHHLDQLSFVRFGVAVARRGWLEREDVLNTYSLSEVKRILSGKG